MIKAIRGTRDLLPPETALWNFVESTVREVFRAYNFQEIRTPIFEDTQLFARGVGEETDIVSKEMYTWNDQGRAQSDKGQSITLRPENTAGVVRAYIEHTQQALLHWPTVSTRAAAEGAIPPVLPDWRRDHWTGDGG
jgi:histidyl-tRNA synthetase